MKQAKKDASPFRCSPEIKHRQWRRVKNWTRAERAMAFCEKYLIVPEGKLVGQPVKLIRCQEDFFYAIFDNPHDTLRAYLSMARKNSKTATIAMIVLVFLVGTEAQRNSQIVSGARSREQASQVYNYASKMVMMSPDLSKLVRIIPSSKCLIGIPMNVEYKAGSAEAKTAMGGSPILAILDEVGQVKGAKDDFIDAIETSQGAHDNPLLIAISTQAAEDADLFSIWLDDAEKSQDPHIVSHVYETPKDAELSDKASWKLSNPALGIFRSERDLAEMIKRAIRMPSSENKTRNLFLNQRVSTVSPFISVDVWKECGGKLIEFGKTPVWVGLDLSGRTDLCAMVIAGKVVDTWHVMAHFWTPEQGLEERAKRDRAPYDLWAKQGWMHTTIGRTVDYQSVAEDMSEILNGLNVKNIAYDRWRIDLLKKEFELLGMSFPLVEFGQGFKDMSPAIEVLEEKLLNGQIAHWNHPVLTMCASNAVTVKDPAGNRKLDKSKSTGRIDGVVALAMAIGISGAKVEKPPSFQLMFV